MPKERGVECGGGGCGSCRNACEHPAEVEEIAAMSSRRCTRAPSLAPSSQHCVALSRERYLQLRGSPQQCRCPLKLCPRTP